jgi:hypothetical protein
MFILSSSSAGTIRINLLKKENPLSPDENPVKNGVVFLNAHLTGVE